MDYGEILKKHRLLSGYSQEEMAYYLGVHQTAISKIENGNRGIDLPVFIGWVQLVKDGEGLLREVGLKAPSPLKLPIEDDYRNAFFGLIKKEMLRQQHL